MAKVLIVEAGTLSRRVAAAALRDAGYFVVEASKGERGLFAARAEEPDVVIVDALLPDMDCGQFARTLRSLPLVERPHLIFRGLVCIEQEATVLARAHDGAFVIKPTQPEAVCEAVARALQSPRPFPALLHSDADLDSGLWRRVTQTLYQRTEALERLSAEQQLRGVKTDKQVAVARAAVDREIKRRLWAEKELARANLQLKDQAMRDIGTGLHNRVYLEESLRREESQAQRYQQAFGIMLIDIDGLREINAAFGHNAGDILMSALGEHLLSVTRGEDIVARFGGDEFAVLMTRAPAEVVRARAEKIHAETRHMAIEYQGKPLGTFALSVGVGIYPDHGKSGKDVIDAAGVALARAKKRGGNCTIVSGATIEESTEHTQPIRQDLTVKVRVLR